jgi:hypothetical protein
MLGIGTRIAERIGYVGYLKHSRFCCRLSSDHPQGCRFAKGGTMEGRYSEELRDELTRLLRKQPEVLESRTFGSAADSDIIEYEIRQEVIHEICNQLANSAVA